MNVLNSKHIPKLYLDLTIGRYMLNWHHYSDLNPVCEHNITVGKSLRSCVQKLSLHNRLCVVYLLTLKSQVLKLLTRKMGKSTVGAENALSISQISFAGFFCRFFGQQRFTICKNEQTVLRILYRTAKSSD